MNMNNQFIIDKIIGSTIVSWCYKKNIQNNIIFDDSNHVIGSKDCYFGTEVIKKLNHKDYKDKNGVTYSINYNGDNISFCFIISKKYLQNEELYKKLLIKFNKQSSNNTIILYEDIITSKNIDISFLENKLEQYYQDKIISFDNDLLNFLNEDEEELHEGKIFEVKLTKYERNKKARKACLAYYGSKCKICGMDFKEKYGNDFDGIIQVHHILPLSEIKEDYIVDPINDLIPVCPNCHVAIHSKKDGYYTIEEMKNIMN